MSSLLRRIVLLALVGGILFDVLVPGNAAGLNATIVMAAFLAAALLVAGRDGIRRMIPRMPGWPPRRSVSPRWPCCAPTTGS